MGGREEIRPERGHLGHEVTFTIHKLSTLVCSVPSPILPLSSWRSVRATVYIAMAPSHSGGNWGSPGFPVLRAFSWQVAGSLALKPGHRP